MGYVDIFADHRGGRNVGASEQFPGSGAQDLQHGLVEPLQPPAFCQLAGKQFVQLVAAGVGAFHHVVEEGDFGLGVLVALNLRAEPVAVKFIEQLRERRAFHVDLIKRLDGSEPRGGAGF